MHEDALGEHLGSLEGSQLPYDAPRLLGSVLEFLWEDPCCAPLDVAETVMHDLVLDFSFGEDDTPAIPNLWCLEKTRTLARLRVQASQD